jgi:hypothetical protein
MFRNQIIILGNGDRLFRRPKLTLSFSAEGKEGRCRLEDNIKIDLGL